jgi:hypothetical protein
MKKIVVIFIAIIGIGIVIKSLLLLINAPFIEIIATNSYKIGYSFGYNLGIMIKPILKMFFGFFIVYQMYLWFCDEEKVNSSIF